MDSKIVALFKRKISYVWIMNILGKRINASNIDQNSISIFWVLEKQTRFVAIGKISDINLAHLSCT